ncbi:MAG: hypothetical protein ACTHNW_20755 [Mucilaginibacter sp.]
MNTPIKQLQTLLKFTYGLVPIIAGADKFANLLTNWSQYMAPWLKIILPFSDHTFMMIVGIIEIVAGIIVLAKPQIGAWIVSAWLVLIAFTLISGGSYFDVAVRDIVMAIGAYVLAKLSIADNRVTA